MNICFLSPTDVKLLHTTQYPLVKLLHHLEPKLIFNVSITVRAWPNTRACHLGRALCQAKARSSLSRVLNSLFTRRTQTCARKFLTLVGRRDDTKSAGAGCDLYEQSTITQRWSIAFRDFTTQKNKEKREKCWNFLF